MVGFVITGLSKNESTCEMLHIALSISCKLHSIFQLEMQNNAKRFLGYWEL